MRSQVLPPSANQAERHVASAFRGNTYGGHVLQTQCLAAEMSTMLSSPSLNARNLLALVFSSSANSPSDPLSRRSTRLTLRRLYPCLGKHRSFIRSTFAAHIPNNSSSAASCSLRSRSYRLVGKSSALLRLPPSRSRIFCPLIW